MLDADEGFILSDRAFVGADILATYYTLFREIMVIGDFDLIICGKQTTDGDTAQVGPAIAEGLDIPHASWVKKSISDRPSTASRICRNAGGGRPGY